MLLWENWFDSHENKPKAPATEQSEQGDPDSKEPSVLRTVYREKNRGSNFTERGRSHADCEWVQMG